MEPKTTFGIGGNQVHSVKLGGRVLIRRKRNFEPFLNLTQQVAVPKIGPSEFKRRKDFVWRESVREETSTQPFAWQSQWDVLKLAIMKAVLWFLMLSMLVGGGRLALAELTPEQVAQLPPPASRTVHFAKDVQPIFEASCIRCHGRGRTKSGFSLETRDSLLKGGDSGPAVVVGKSADSYLIELVSGLNPDTVMPMKGSRLTPVQVGLLRAWIDQGLVWDAGVTFAKRPPRNLQPRQPELPPAVAGRTHPIDRLLAAYLAAQHVDAMQTVGDRVFARRVYLDVIGLLPSPDELKAFLDDARADKRERLVDRLLADKRRYADHWLTFWNDALRNDYRGTGYIDGGRKQITSWLYTALANNLPYDQLVAQLVNPTPASEGFVKGIVWRGVVNASQAPEMQTAQNISQLFMGVNLKCASCHDSFINDWTLADAYGMAAVYADGPLPMFRCDKPTGHQALAKFLYPELGTIPTDAPKAEKERRLAEILTSRQNGRLSRTIVNRLWQKFLGVGLVEPLDDMEQPAWHPDLLDWLAEDLVAHGYDLKRTMQLILTSHAYQMPAVNHDDQKRPDYVFTGPAVRRMTAEEFRDALGQLTGVWYAKAAFKMDDTHLPPRKGDQASAANPGQVRTSLVPADPLTTALGRPPREQMMTCRQATATTLQALELTNGKTLTRILEEGARKLLAKPPDSTEDLVRQLYLSGLGRLPGDAELDDARELIGEPARPEPVEDFLWAMAMLPEFQLIY